MKERSLEDILREKLSKRELPATPGAWEKIQDGLNKPRNNSAWYYLAAASIVGVILVSILYLQKEKPVATNFYPVAHKKIIVKKDTASVIRKNHPIEEKHDAVPYVAHDEKSTPEKKRPSFLVQSKHSTEEQYLPDSTLVFLNNSSRLEMQYDANSSRLIHMEGEVFFKVKNIRNIPFKINAGNSIIEVVGTSFNVRMYSVDSIEVLVEEGKVRFGKKDDFQHSVLLTAGEKGIANQLGVIKAAGFSRNEFAWRTGEIEFKKTKMSEAVHVLEDYFKTKIRVSDQGVLNCHVTAKFRQPRLDKVLDLFSALIHIQYEKKDQEYVLTGKGCD